jgi:hypothetical protein
MKSCEKDKKLTVNQIYSLHEAVKQVSNWSLRKGISKPENTYVIYCHTLVSPGMGATVHTFLALRVFIIELLPVLG